MDLGAANQIALRAAKALFRQARPLDIVIENVPVHVNPQPEANPGWPLFPGGEPIPGLDAESDGPWPAPVRLECTWSAGRVELIMRWNLWRASVRYRGQLGLEVATLPRNRQVLWTTVTQRILDVSPAAAMASDASISGSLALFDRERGDHKRAYVRYQIEIARKLGLPFLAPVTVDLFRIPREFSGSLEPQAFERVVSTALVKLPFVTRGEASDLTGQPYVDIQRALAPVTGESAPSTPGEAPAAPARELSATLPLPALGGPPTALEARAEEAAPPEPPAELAAQDVVLFEQIHAVGFGPFDNFRWDDLGQINVIVGRNDAGKSTLLKLAYVLARSVQDYTRRMNSDRRPFREVLAEKLMWTFQPEGGRLGDLVKKRCSEATFGSVLCNAEYSARLSPSDERSVGVIAEGVPLPNLRALFIPPKEILTSTDAIIALHDEGRFGFDDTYYDLAKALRPEGTQRELPDSLRRVLEELRALFSGEIVSERGKLVFQRGEDRFWMSQVAEGIKKIGILARLISNGEIQRDTVLFMDEPETNLHPAAVRRLMRMLHDISRAGVQIFLATHSYFVLKQLEIISREHKDGIEVRVCALAKQGGQVGYEIHDLAEGMPPNEIVEESLSMGDEDVDVAMRT
jgi:energy-coupling factor transporter ATP-binding protein EcfA2